MDPYVGIVPTRADLIAAIREVIVKMKTPENAQNRRNIISHVPIAMLECIAVRSGESLKYHVRPMQARNKLFYSSLSVNIGQTLLLKNTT